MIFIRIFHCITCAISHTAIWINKTNTAFLISWSIKSEADCCQTHGDKHTPPDSNFEQITEQAERNSCPGECCIMLAAQMSVCIQSQTRERRSDGMCY